MEYNNRSTPYILIVDDVEANLVILEEMIKSLGYRAKTSFSVKEAIPMIEEELPQIILSDIAMPDIDGYQFCGILKKEPRTRDIPLMFISAMDSPTEKIKGLKLGAVDFIAKPFSLEEVMVRLNTHMKIYAMQQEMERYNYKLNLIVSKQMEKVEEEQKNILLALAKVTEGGREVEGSNHLENVANNAYILAQSLTFRSDYENQISNNFIETIGVAALLHDIGKIAIPDYILLKPGKLSIREKEIIQTHAEKGAEILRGVYSNCGKNEFVKMAIDIAGNHHEKWDGSGYPNGLKGEEISVASRIVGVVETYDTLINQRCYKEAYSQSRAMEIMEQEIGRSFDPKIMEVFLKVVRQFSNSMGGN